jgi:hypothetical protein
MANDTHDLLKSAGQSLHEIRGTLQQFRGRLHEIEQSLDELDFQRHEIESAPVPNDELVERIHAAVDAKAENYARYVEQAVAAVSSPAGIPRSFSVIPDPSESYLEDGYLAFFFGQTVKERLASVIDRMPRNAGLRTDERPAALEKVDRQVAELLEEQRKLIAEARKAGFKVVVGREAERVNEQVLDGTDPAVQREHLQMSGRPGGLGHETPNVVVEHQVHGMDPYD